MPLLHITAFVRFAGLDLPPFQPVVLQQSLVTSSEFALIAHVVYRRRHPVCLVLQWHAAKFPERILQAIAQTFKALRIADRRRFPVRIRKHKVIEQVRKSLPFNRDFERVHVREIGLAQSAGHMLLRKENLLPRSFGCTPMLQAPL